MAGSFLRGSTKERKRFHVTYRCIAPLTVSVSGCFGLRSLKNISGSFGTIFRSQAAIVFKKTIVFTFSHVKAYVSKIDLAVKQVKFILGSSFDQTMMSWSPKCYIPSFVKLAQPVLEKIFECFFLTYMGVAAILVM